MVDRGEAIVKAQKEIAEQCDAVKTLLLTKNNEYGNSALEPINVFSGLDAKAQIDVRIDDKLKRIQTVRQMSGPATIHEDTVLDLIGYLVLRRVAEKLAGIPS